MWWSMWLSMWMYFLNPPIPVQGKPWRRSIIDSSGGNHRTTLHASWAVFQATWLQVHDQACRWIPATGWLEAFQADEENHYSNRRLLAERSLARWHGMQKDKWITWTTELLVTRFGCLSWTQLDSGEISAGLAEQTHGSSWTFCFQHPSRSYFPNVSRHHSWVSLLDLVVWTTKGFRTLQSCILQSEIFRIAQLHPALHSTEDTTGCKIFIRGRDIGTLSFQAAKSVHQNTFYCWTRNLVCFIDTRKIYQCISMPLQYSHRVSFESGMVAYVQVTNGKRTRKQQCLSMSWAQLQLASREKNGRNRHRWGAYRGWDGGGHISGNCPLSRLRQPYHWENLSLFQSVFRGKTTGADPPLRASRGTFAESRKSRIRVRLSLG